MNLDVLAQAVFGDGDELDWSRVKVTIPMNGDTDGAICRIVDEEIDESWYLAHSNDSWWPVVALIHARNAYEADEIWFDEVASPLDELAQEDYRADYGDDPGDWPEVQINSSGVVVCGAGGVGSDRPFDWSTANIYPNPNRQEHQR